MSAKKSPEELAEEYAFGEEQYTDNPYPIAINSYLAGYKQAQANPTPEAIEKLACFEWLISELKRRAGGGE